MAPTKNPAKTARGQIDHGRFGYARVSTRGQTLDVQLSALEAAGVASANVFAEKKSGKAGSARPQWEDVRSRLRPGDTLVVSKLDRMGRDMREIMETAWSLQDLGAKLEILSGPLAGIYDPRGMGKIFFATLAGFAEMEREMMIERTNDGLAQAAAEGRHGGRRPVISKDMMRIALGRRADGESVTSIANGLTYRTADGEERTVSRRALYNAFKAYDAERVASA
ncbi:recombinase family protein [Catenulispora pinisilvae]|uniref:recombinase family protein n=1 Tax=Catenulispora pinisilvae TaxID=2705253 RepID=UPI00189139A5|nr:recombinase family protein [Catenulispora pinisilvae]